MSAFLVSQYHIDMLVKAALPDGFRRSEAMRYVWQGKDKICSRDQADTIGRMLWLENYLSIAHSYPNYARAASFEVPLLYQWTDHRDRKSQLPAIHMLKALACYEYQSCEHPGWEESEALRFCRSLRKHLIYQIHGYSDGPWALTDPTAPSPAETRSVASA